MNVSELLSYRPEKPELKRHQDADDVQQKKKKKLAIDAVSVGRERVTAVVDSGQKSPSEEIKENVERILELDESNPVPQLDEAEVKRLILQFEKKYTRNQEMRIKHPEQPNKFMDSEVDLHQAIHELRAVASVPEYHQLLVQLGCTKSLVSVLSHENNDVAVAAIELLQELTDTDVQDDSAQGENSVVDSLVAQHVLQSAVQLFDRLDEFHGDEDEGVHNTLGVVENLLELRPALCGDASVQALLQWLLKRIKYKSTVPNRMVDPNKLYASELLAILTQQNDANRENVGAFAGVDVLLAQLAQFKRHDPRLPDDLEYMENIFNVLCSCLALSSNKDRFLKGEGVQLMNLMMREKKLARLSAIRVLNHALSGADGAPLCDKFVQVLGLRTIFPLFMKPPRPNAKQGLSELELEEHIIAVVAALLTHCTPPHKLRVVTKFCENSFEKIERLIELHFAYLERVRGVDQTIEEERRDLLDTLGRVPPDTDDEFYFRRLDSGLFTLQQIDLVLLHVITASVDEAQQMREKVTKLLTLRGGSMADVRQVVLEYADSMGADSAQDAEQTDARTVAAPNAAAEAHKIRALLKQLK